MKCESIDYYEKYLRVEPKVDDGIDADGRLGEHGGQRQQVM